MFGYSLLKNRFILFLSGFLVSFISFISIPIHAQDIQESSLSESDCIVFYNTGQEQRYENLEELISKDKKTGIDISDFYITGIAETDKSHGLLEDYGLLIKSDPSNKDLDLVYDGKSVNVDKGSNFTSFLIGIDKSQTQPEETEISDNKLSEKTLIPVKIFNKDSQNSLVTISDNTNEIEEDFSEVKTSIPGESKANDSEENDSEIPVESITLNMDTLYIDLGFEVTLKAVIEPEDATDKTVVWSSSDDEIATVDEEGTVEGVNPGTAIITAQASNGLTATCSVTVKEQLVEVTGVKVEPTEISLFKDETEQLKAVVSPEDATNKQLIWQSSMPSIATVDENGLVTAVDMGTAVIRVTTVDGGYSASCTVTVKTEEIPVNSIWISPSSLNLSSLSQGTHTAQLNAQVSPANTTETIKWVSSAPGVASVSGKGLSATVNANSEGIATISAEAGSKVATVIVQVSNNAFIADSIQITAVTPDQFTVTAVNVRSNPALPGIRDGVQKVSMFTWSGLQQNDMDAKVAIQEGSNWYYTFPVNGTKENNFYYEADSIKIHVYASSSSNSDGSLIGTFKYSWINSQSAGNNKLTYIAYLQNTGFDQPSVFDGNVSGDPNQNRHMEGLRISSNVDGVSITTSVHAQTIGWMQAVPDGSYAGTMWENRPIEAVRLELSGNNASKYRLSYRVYCEKKGWTDYASTGEIAGTVGENQSIRAIEVQLLPR